MHTFTATLTLLFVVTAAAAIDAKPHTSRKATKAAQERFVLECVDERTGPTDGIEVDEAFKLCRGIVRHQAKIAKAAELAARARAAGMKRLTERLERDCAEAVSIACEDTTLRETDGGECDDKALEAKHAFDVCRAPVAVK